MHRSSGRPGPTCSPPWTWGIRITLAAGCASRSAGTIRPSPSCGPGTPGPSGGPNGKRSIGSAPGPWPKRAACRPPSRAAATASPGPLVPPPFASSSRCFGKAQRTTPRAPLAKSCTSAEVDVAPVHDIDGPGLHQQVVEDGDLVRFPLGDVDHARDAAPQVELGMPRDRGLALAEAGPREEREAEVDRHGVEGV